MGHGGILARRFGFPLPQGEGEGIVTRDERLNCSTSLHDADAEH